jgi:enterochelin esterase-like enzyme
MGKAAIPALALSLVALTAAGRATAALVELGTPVEIDSKVLGRTMALAVHLPQGYEASAERYPVLYMLGSEWRSRFALAAATLDTMHAMGRIPAVILVGIDLPDGNFVLVPRGDPPDTSGPDAHLTFLATEVIPRVENDYRTAPFRMLYGASNSGLFVVYALLTRPLVADAYLASSPMLGWCGELLAERARRTLAATDLPRRTLAVVYSDDDYGRVVDAVPPFLATLDRARPSWLSWSREVRHSEGHVPVVDLPLVLEAIFPDYSAPPTLASLDEVVAHYGSLSKRYGFEVPVPGDVVFDLGMQHLAAGRLEPAQRCFEWEVKNRPRSARGYVGTGLVQERRGERETALEWLRKGLEVDPGDTLARRQLARLSGPE